MEGYIGIQIGEYQLVKDVIFAILLFLFLTFALIFNSHFRQFSKMMKNVVHVKQRQSLFEVTLGNIKENQWLFHIFMIFQALLLCALFAYYAGITILQLPVGSLKTILSCIGISLAVITLFYFFKQGIYRLFGWTFADPERTKLWKINYIATIESGGILFYPLIILSFFSNIQPIFSLLLFFFLYILCRFVIFYKSIRIFQIKEDGLLFFFLYLCAQEIMPLFLLFKGVEFLYNFIDVSTLWR
ncbi:DUF4271 domain-containing protein [Parabacteroides sp. PF5-6]|uniref:DUF4271 domain-containing protein n=1 Tax=Parabacteroides sp. PF5-6 TaxID=1742403 RepID=UPI002404A33F|nr:DUF4271 domain-containing protein [Parabacteroides sp. PF5-6]MDF9831175.1 flagellar biosynthesis protein FlhB [Parabacteroides sp. PF5-6]